MVPFDAVQALTRLGTAADKKEEEHSELRMLRTCSSQGRFRTLMHALESRELHRAMESDLLGAKAGEKRAKVVVLMTALAMQLQPELFAARYKEQGPWTTFVKYAIDPSSEKGNKLW